MKHAVSISSSSAMRHPHQRGVALLLLLVLMAMQSRILLLEPLAEQLISVNDGIGYEQLLLTNSADSGDQPCDLLPVTEINTALQSPGFSLLSIEAPLTSSARWTTPSTRAPPAVS
ncbi:hypothetical protein [Amphritea pacifica]|uniref:DUF2946 domain-containing protein n=2 Tax=Amphritea pacifica TaxID=2811233 RepID=A0ABS2W4W4_9GAMM|nr:hypothetical protein [Amphritea pacifica]MBN0986452.1 hypothetical protein [Amphritea pacifica]